MGSGRGRDRSIVNSDAGAPDPSPSDTVETPLSALDQAVPTPSKTPLFQATNALRYQRQATIKVIQEQTGRQLICYVAGSLAPVDRDDTIGFVDLLHNVRGGQDLDLLLHTGGGDIDAAEKLISMVRTKVGTATLRVVVPDYAKSAGTLIALGADLIVMSETSELGPIDPQIVLADSNGNRIQHPVQTYLDAYKTHSDTLAKNPSDVAARIMLGKLDPATVKLYEAVRARAQAFAEAQLRRGMFKNEGNWSQAASQLIDTHQWKSHGQMIGWQDAQDPKIGLAVEHLDAETELWKSYWPALLSPATRCPRPTEALRESEFASLVIDSAAG
jgi:ATP-dependent protease ClpP protease subunit